MLKNSTIKAFLHSHKFILAQGAIVEQLRWTYKIEMHPELVDAPLVLDQQGQKYLTHLYQSYINIALNAQIPIMIWTPTGRADRDRLKKYPAMIKLNQKAVHFLKNLRQQQGLFQNKILVGGSLCCKNDNYQPSQALSVTEAKTYHSWQANALAEGGADFLLAETLPALSEATGIASAFSATRVPFIIGFVINKTGCVLDGNTLATAIKTIDDQSPQAPLGYWINCSYPTFLKAHDQPPEVLKRILGYTANASSLDHGKLDNSPKLHVDPVKNWGEEMVLLHQKFGIKILGGCCGTGPKHLQYLVEHHYD